MISVASCSRKRPNEFVSPERSGVKLQKTAFFFVLESESEVTASESDTESVLSVQSRSTEFVRDTSDTSSKASQCGTDVERESMEGVEYEVVSLISDHERPFNDISSGAGTDEDTANMRKCLLRTSEEEGVSDWSVCGDVSSVADSGAAGVNEPLPSRACVKCKARTCGVPFCSQCYKVRKDFFPPRPKGRKNRNSKNTYKRKLFTKEVAKLPLLKSLESSGQSSQGLCALPPTATDNLCNVCFTNPKNGAFLHCHWVHIYACYQCSVKIWFTTKKCPLCHGKIDSVRKVAIG